MKVPVPRRIRTEVFCAIALELGLSLSKNISWTNLRRLAEKHLPRQYKEYASDLLEYYVNRDLLTWHGGRQTLMLTEHGRQLALELCLENQD